MTGRKYIAKALIVLILLGICPVGLQAAKIDIREDFDFGAWSPLVSRWKKVVPVCIWDESVSETSFKVVAGGSNSSRRFRLKNDINDKIAYRVHWRDSNAYTSKERLKANVSSSQIYKSNDTNRCQSGPTGFVEVTINRKALNEAAPGIYSDTLFVMISAL